jgi:hypothetical protein
MTELATSTSQGDSGVLNRATDVPDAATVPPCARTDVGSHRVRWRCHHCICTWAVRLLIADELAVMVTSPA